MRKNLNILASLILLYVIYVALINFGQSADINLGIISMFANLGVFILCIVLIGTFFGASIVGYFYSLQKEKLNAYKRELEKSSVSNSTSTSKVEVLEAKIATLEKALDNALNKE